ncbi:unnamed protein product [Pleuronectes platessa]|uniref:Uncharacterized protein n=1 Tax=Pleuronectes platessa TaxID=8262 RepID=A0A9N7UUX0_PLEPL|nr:unnamed protein product [Pleuronectes platessa]
MAALGCNGSHGGREKFSFVESASGLKRVEQTKRLSSVSSRLLFTGTRNNLSYSSARWRRTDQTWRGASERDGGVGGAADRRQVEQASADCQQPSVTAAFN